MTLITSQTIRPKEAIYMADKTADKAITATNSNGQTVVVVQAGQPIPDDVDARVAAIEGKAQETAPENKARSRAAKK